MHDVGKAVGLPAAVKAYPLGALAELGLEATTDGMTLAARVAMHVALKPLASALPCPAQATCFNFARWAYDVSPAVLVSQGCSSMHRRQHYLEHVILLSEGSQQSGGAQK